MEILQFLLSFFLEEYGKDYKPLFEMFQQNNFDIKRTLQNVSPETVIPLLKNILSFNKQNPTDFNSQSVGLSPIKNIADSEIVYSLNKYLGE